MSKPLGEVVTRNIANLNTTIYVRKELDMENVMRLAEFVEAKTTLPPILITKDNVVVDGRSRIEAYLLNNIHTVRCQIVRVRDESDLISQAYLANAGGAAPPKRKDTEHAVMLLLDRGATIGYVAKLLGIPIPLARAYCRSVKARYARANMQRARDAVAGGMRAVDAAVKFSVELGSLREQVSGRRRKQNTASKVLGALSTTYKSLTAKNANVCRRLGEQFADGEISEEEARTILKKLKTSLGNATRAISSWESRFDSLIESGKGSAE